MKRLHLAIFVILLVLASGLGWFFGQQSTRSSTASSNLASDSLGDAAMTKANNGVVQDNSGKTVLYWYDPMVPNQKFDKPGKSPFMDMQLAPKYANASSNGNEGNDENSVEISAQTTQNLGIRLEKVAMQSFGKSFSTIGRIEPNERRIYVVQTRVPGFVERLTLRAVGDPVSKGQKVAEIYAPELLAAQQEYLTILSLNGIDNDNSLKDAARSRLKLLGMTEGEISAITKSGQASPRFGVYAPASGVVTELGVREGGQLMAGSSLVQIVDLSQVWVIAEVPERDAARLKLGIAVEVQLQSLPGEVFNGKVAYLYPMLNDSARTLQVRIELTNQGNRLRPGMFANIVFTGQKYEALSVSSDSIIATGKRKIVIVKEANGYRPVEVITGQEHDQMTEILSGLAVDEAVVISGQFLIDSEASLSGVLARLSHNNQSSTEKLLSPNKVASSKSSSKPEMADMRETPKVLETADSNKIKMPNGRGRIIELDIQSSKVILYHEPIEALGWPAMTMGFKVKDSKQLNQLKAGDAVEFDLKAQPAEKPNMPTQYGIERLTKVSTSKASQMGAKP